MILKFSSGNVTYAAGSIGRLSVTIIAWNAVEYRMNISLTRHIKGRWRVKQWTWKGVDRAGAAHYPSIRWAVREKSAETHRKDSPPWTDIWARDLPNTTQESCSFDCDLRSHAEPSVSELVSCTNAQCCCDVCRGTIGVFTKSFKFWLLF